MWPFWIQYSLLLEEIVEKDKVPTGELNASLVCLGFFENLNLHNFIKMKLPAMSGFSVHAAANKEDKHHASYM